MQTLFGSKHKPATRVAENSSKDVAVQDESRSTLLASHGFVVRKTIGHGSYASVKVAYCRTLRRKVAIKIISKKKAPPEFVKKFLPRELGLVKVLKHPHIVAFYQYIDTPTRVYLVMELAENGDLFQVLRNTYIPEPRVGLWFCQIVDALNYCHKQGVVHRDLKCDNLLLDRQNNVKISDFGFAKVGVYDELKPKDLSRTFCGSYPYACPEILKSEPYDPKAADVWSLGVVLFVMMYRRLPYDDRNLKILIESQKNPLAFPVSPDISDDCKACITRILQVKNRPTVGEVARDPWCVQMELRRQRKERNKGDRPSISSKSNASSSDKGSARKNRDKEKDKDKSLNYAVKLGIAEPEPTGITYFTAAT